MVKPVFLLINTANISVPSITEPPLMASPIPNPKKKPPKKATSNLSSVMVGKGTKCTDIASNAMAITLLTASCKLMV